MTEYILMLCLGLILVCVVSHNKINKRIEEFKAELAELQAQERSARGQRRQAEGILVSFEMQEREIKKANEKLKKQLKEVRKWVEEFKAVAMMSMMGTGVEAETEADAEN